MLVGKAVARAPPSLVYIHFVKFELPRIPRYLEQSKQGNDPWGKIILEHVGQKKTSILIPTKMRGLRGFDVKQNMTCMRIYNATSIASSDSHFLMQFNHRV